jgi:fused signal recognition particle receptor
MFAGPMDPQLWNEIAAWLDANALTAAGALAVVALAGAVAVVRRRRRAPAAGPIAERIADAVVPAADIPVEALPEPEQPVAPAPAKLRDRLRRTSDALVGGLGKLLGGSVDDALLESLEEQLLHADLGVRTATELLERVRREGRGRDASAVREILRTAITEKLRRVESGKGLAVEAKPHVVLVLGVNGSGKTTTIGKLAARHAAAGRKVLLGAADTFRARRSSSSRCGASARAAR